MLPGGRGEEFVIIAVIALIVVGPKDLPKLLRQLGRFVGKMRAMADDFRSSFEDMARQSELDDLRKEVEAMRSKSMSGIDSVKDQFNTLTSDTHMTPLPHSSFDAPAPGEETEIVNTAPVASDPQMEGLPPQGHPVAPVTEAPLADVVVKTPRVRKPKTSVAAAEPVAQTSAPAKRRKASENKAAEKPAALSEAVVEPKPRRSRK